MAKAPKIPTKSQFRSLLKKVGQLDDDAVISMDAATGGRWEKNWQGLSRSEKIDLYRSYMKRLAQKKTAPYRIFQKDGSPEFSD
mgnify:CR=1 FL=1|tara:strand:+ start:177 stop:428 length:252 start_codon:yes stop_codon:yes gene_type:complete